jgi:hypothetical protein
METFRNTIAPVLTIRHVAQAVAFYERAFETKRSTAVPTRTAGSSEMAIDGARFWVADETPEASNLSPQALNGTMVRINLLVADPDQLSERAIAVGHGPGDRPPLSPRALGIYRIEAPHLQVRNGVERLGLSEATHVDFDEPSFSSSRTSVSAS